MADNGWLRIEDVDPQLAYQKSFGDIPNHTRYYDPLGGVDLGKSIRTAQNEFAKAVNVGAASGTAGYAFTPIVYDRNVVDITRKFTPLLALIPKVTNIGKTAEYYRITARGGASWGTEEGSITETDDTASEVSNAIKYLRIKGRVSGVAQAAGAHFLDAMQQQVVNKTQSVNEELEDTLLNGNNSTNPLRPDGLIAQLTSNNTDLTGTTKITLSQVRKTVSDCYNAKGRPNLIITDSYTADVLHEEMMQFARYVNPMTQLGWGAETLAISTNIGRLPVVVSQFMPIVPTERRLLVVGTDFVEYRVLQDVTFERLAKTEDAESFYLKTYRTLVNKFPEGMGMVYNIP